MTSGVGGTRTLLALAAAAATAGCGTGSGENGPSADPGEPPATTQPPSTAPPGYPRRVATGSLRDGSRWSLSETGLGQVCIRVTREENRAADCLDLKATWLVGVRSLEGPGGRGVLVLAGLPCGVSRVELRSGGETLDAATTTVSDDVNYAVLEGPERLDGVKLVALGRDGTELFRVDRLRDAPSARVPTIGC